jgi:drug/metabolite transporter (DMT)-like permease
VKNTASERKWLAAVKSPVLGLTLAVLFWSGNFIVGRALREDISPLTLNLWRWIIALAILLPFTLRTLIQHRHQLARLWLLLLSLAFTGIACFQTFVYLALITTTAVNALLLLCLTPVLIIIGNWLLYRDRATWLQIAGMAVAFAGAVMLIARGDLRALTTLRFGTGDLWMLVAIVMWAVYSLLVKKKPVDTPQTVLLSASTLIAVLLMLPVAILTDQLTVTLNPHTTWGILYVAIFPSVLAFLLWNRGVIQIGPGRTGTLMYLMPFFGAALSLLFLDEKIQLYQLAGGALVLGGVIVLNWRQST